MLLGFVSVNGNDMKTVSTIFLQFCLKCNHLKRKKFPGYLGIQNGAKRSKAYHVIKKSPAGFSAKTTATILNTKALETGL